MKLSVIIPAYNEEEVITQTISELRKRAGGVVEEIIVVDGDSGDDTVKRAESVGAVVITSPKKGRAAQMNYGAERAVGEILYFLHADSIPPPNFDRQIIRAVADEHKAGCFRLAFDEDHFLLDFYAWFTRFDINAFRFGDQSLFILGETFWTIGGFREDYMVMEDNEIVRRIKKRHSFSVLDDTVETSARTYREVGIVKLQLIFLLIYALYFWGVEQETLGDIRKCAVK